MVTNKKEQKNCGSAAKTHVATIKDTSIAELVIKSFFFKLLNFLDILFMLLYNEFDCYGSPKSGVIVDHYCRPYYNSTLSPPSTEF